MTPKTVLALISSIAAIALVGCGDNGSSNILTPTVDTVPPATPTGVSVDQTVTNVLISWDANSEPDLAGYVLERSLDNGTTWETLGSAALTTNDYSDYKYPHADYRVAAMDDSQNQSAYSSEVSFSLPDRGPKIPSQPWAPVN
ncbi:fibronectin type III domain-containing protein [bacterium]|nr:fibronectin type III domain-containing protein [bacterium]